MALQGKEREEFEKKLEAYVGIDIGIEEIGPDAVNAAMIRHWCDAMGDENPIYRNADAAKASVHGEIVAPPTMLQAWILPGLEMALGEDDPRNKQRELHRLFDSVGYTGVVATNCEQEYTRYLKLGDEIKAVTTIEEISEQKATALGIGYFINTRTVFTDQNGEEVGWMTFRVLKFESGAQPAAADDGAASPMAGKPQRIRPALGADNKWWWDALDEGRFLIQRCASCRALRHPTRPMCPECRSTEWDSVESTMKGSVYSFVVIRYPEVPGYEYPLPVAVIDLEEGTRYVGNLVDVDPETIEIGMTVEGSIEEGEDGMKLPVFRPVAG